MRLTAAIGVIQTLAANLDIEFDHALQYIQENYNDKDIINKYQRIAYECYVRYALLQSN
jgi:hypothetical protein